VRAGGQQQLRAALGRQALAAVLHRLRVHYLRAPAAAPEC